MKCHLTSYISLKQLRVLSEDMQLHRCMKM